MQAVQAVIRQTGGPDAIGFDQVELGKPGPGQVLMRHEAVGVNFIDTYHRSGLYEVPLPSGLGLEASGVVEEVGEGVGNVRPGDRVATFKSGLGAYANARIVDAKWLVPLPDAVDFEQAAALMLKGCTAEALIERCAGVKRGDVVLVHAGAGATGQIMVRWLAHIGARVVATASTEEKRATARAAGASLVCGYGEEELLDTVRQASERKGADVIFDGVGADTWEMSLKAAKCRGLVVSFGNASGPVTGVSIGALSAHGSLFTTRPTMMHYYAKDDEFRAGTSRLMQMIADGIVHADIGTRLPLQDAAKAHRMLEDRKTVGATILKP